jgi:DNA-binding LytR/AlgR family response regulator
MRHEEIIAALGFEPVGFLQATDAIEAVQNAPDRFDAALLCHLHGTNATFDLARALSHIAPMMPILLATTAAGDLGAPMLASVGICAVVGLPVRSGELSSALARCIATAPRKRRLSSTQAIRFMHP